MGSDSIFRATLTGITLTGADERTDLNRLVLMAIAHPNVEIGLLYTATPEGRNRYPTLSWLHQAAARLSGRCAIHVCGRLAREQLLQGQLADLVSDAARVQVNGIVHPSELNALAARVPVLITQMNAANASLATEFYVKNHQLLVDGSGGRGKSPDGWVRPITSKRVGFAGGLGEDNIYAELERIKLVALGPWWIDLEGKLRTDDWFDLDKCESFLALVRAHTVKKADLVTEGVRA